MSNLNTLVLPEPAGCLVTVEGESHHLDANLECAELWVAEEQKNGAPYVFGYENLYTEQQVRALLATVTGLPAQSVKLLAADHSGMKVDYRGLFSQVQRAIKRTDPGYAEMLRQLEGHLQELGQRWYAGDTDVVDEILQLYCIERDARKTVGAAATAAPQAQADARDAEQERWMEIGKAIERACIDQPDSTEIVISLERDAGTVTMFDPDGNEHDQFSHEDGFTGVVNAAIEAAIAAAKGE